MGDDGGNKDNQAPEWKERGENLRHNLRFALTCECGSNTWSIFSNGEGEEWTEITYVNCNVCGQVRDFMSVLEKGWFERIQGVA